MWYIFWVYGPSLSYWSFAPDRIEQEYLRLVEVCKRMGRDPTSLDLTANLMVHLS